MKKVLKTHIWFVVLLLILAIYLGLKTLPEDGWDGWGETGSAGTMMTMKHWVTDGMAYHKFLFIPMGYSKTMRYLDEPEISHLARGTVVGGLIGQWTHYNHYPSGYLIPYGILSKLGFEARHWFRLLALIFSLAGLVLFYAFFCRISNKIIAFLAVLYYAGSVMFLDFASSLANQPLDDLFRFTILFLSVLAVRAVDNIKKCRIYKIFIWLCYFILAISSYDSTFFIFIWLVGLDIITKWHFLKESAEPRSKWLKAILVRGLFFASAPAVAFVLQILQSWWYFGSWHLVYSDVVGAGIAKSQGSNMLMHLRGAFNTFSQLTGFKILWAVLIVLILFVVFWKLKSKLKSEDKDISCLLPISVVFFFAGIVYTFVFPGADFSYQGRQMAPFVGLLIGATTYLTGKYFWQRKKELLFFFAVSALLLIFWFGQAGRTITYIKDWPNNKVDAKIIEFARSLKQIAGNSDTAIFRLDSVSLSRYPYTPPRAEYYIGMPVFSFKRIPDLARDYKWLKNRSEYPFHTIMLVDDQQSMEKLKELLGDVKDNVIVISPNLNIY